MTLSGSNMMKLKDWPNKNDIARLINGALYIVCTTVSVVTVVAISTAYAATSNAASVAALAVFVIASVAVSAKTPDILSGANNQADAYRVCVVVNDADDRGLFIIFIGICVIC